MQSLQPFHTFNIPANAREIIEATSIEQIQQAWQKAQAENLPVLFLGQGSNMLFLEWHLKCITPLITKLSIKVRLTSLIWFW